MRSRLVFVAIGLLAGVVFDAAVALAWTGPTASAPGNNVGAPLNVGSTAQVKNGDLGANTITAFGNVQLDAGWNPTPSTITYLNFSNAQYPTVPTWGVNGYGIRDNNGTLEFKNSTGSWTALSSLVGYWAASGGNIYNSNAGNVGIGTNAPAKKLEVTTAHVYNIDDEIRIGSYYLSNFYGIGLNYRIDGAGTPSQYLVSYSGGTRSTNLALGANGNVGINTTNPTEKLMIADSIFPRIGLLKNGIGTWYLGGDTTAGTNFNITLNATKMMAIGTNYYVGLGTASNNPTYPLEIGNGSVNPSIDLHYTGAAAAGNKGALYFTHNRASDGTNEYLGYIQGVAEDNQSSGGMRFVTRANTDIETMRLTSTGRVGIGTTGPGYPLHVYGNINGNYVAMFQNAGTHGAVAMATTYGLVGYASASGGNGILGQNTYYNSLGYIGSGPHGVLGYGSASGNGFGVYGIAQCGTSACVGVYGSSGSYYAEIGRADGYSYVGSGALYNSGTVYGTAFIYLSDIRLKHNVQNLDNGLVTLMKLRPVTFTWNDHIKGANGEIDPRSGTNDLGFIAQEVEKIVPKAVDTDPATGYKAIDYPRLVPILVKSIQEQEVTIQTQQLKIDELESRVEKLEAKLSK